MKVMRKTRISVALAAALAGVGASTQVMAVNKSADNIGDAFIGPYFTTRGGWSTDFTVINTSNSTVPVKVRFHEANNSREVLDFIVVLSPQDMVQAIVQEGPNGPRLSFPAQGETSCVVPQPTNRPLNGSGGYFDFNTLDYTGANEDYEGFPGPDGERASIDRAREGYFTIIAMGAAIPGVENDDKYVVPFNSNHPDLHCDKVIAAFQRDSDDPLAPQGANIVKTYAEFERNVNALKASYSLTNVARGVQGSGEMVTLANFATAYSLLNPTPTWQYWAKIQEQQYVDAYKTAWTALNAAWTTLDAASTNSIAAGCTDNLGPKADYIPPGNDASPEGNTDATPVDGGDRPTGAACGAGALAAYDDAAIAFNQAVAAHNKALADWQDAFQEIATTRVRNLISAQGSFNIADPSYRVDSRYPNLDSGDLWAINNWDGEYLMGPLYCAHAFPADWQLSGQAVLDSRGCPFRGFSWTSIYLRGVDAVTNLLMTSDVINEWAVNPVTGASSDWILTAPTKRFYTDFAYVYPGIGNYFPILINGADKIVKLLEGKTSIIGGGIAPFANEWAGFKSCDEVGYNVYNRDEAGPAGPGPQPSPHDSITLCNEVNVLYFNGEPMMDSHVAQAVTAAAPLGTNGWMGVDMTVSFNHPDLDNSQYHPALGFTFQHWNWVVGMPWVGFMMKERNLGQAASYGGIVEHSYIREIGFEGPSIWDLWPLPPEDPCDFFPNAQFCQPPVDEEPET